MPLHRAGFLSKYSRLDICGSIKYRLEVYMVDTNMIPNDLKELTCRSLSPTCDTRRRSSCKSVIQIFIIKCYLELGLKATQQSKESTRVKNLSGTSSFVTWNTFSYLFSLMTVTYQFTISHFVSARSTASPAHYSEMVLASLQINMTLVLRMARKRGQTPGLPDLGQRMEL